MEPAVAATNGVAMGKGGLAFTLRTGVAAALLAGCGASAGAPSSLPHAQSAPQGIDKIAHIVIVVQENRSFDDLFYGFPGAHTVKYGFDSFGHKIKLRPIDLQADIDIVHNADAFFSACNGAGSYPGTDCRMNGFNTETADCGGNGQPQCPFKYPPYAYVPHDETKPYFDMAKEYVLADRMFTSNFDSSSFVSHQYIIAAQAASTVNYPDTWWGCEGGRTDEIGTVNQQRKPSGNVPVCFNYTTLGDELDDARVPWAFYTGAIDTAGGIWSAYQAVEHIFHKADWHDDIITPQTKFFDDVRNARLRPVSWVVPTWVNSDHAGSRSATGPSWVASLVNAIGQSRYWSSTAIFIFWDDYGGWYDDVPPPFADYDGLGIRVPLLVISPYAKRGYVSHTQYEHGSILKFVEDRFGLPRMAASDTRANSLDDCFDFDRAPRAFVPIKAPYGEKFFARQPPDRHIPDNE
jgi:phospholipase C